MNKAYDLHAAVVLICMAMVFFLLDYLVLSGLFLVGAIVAMAFLFRRQNREDESYRQRLGDSENQLREALIEAQNLAITRLGSADNDTRARAVELLVEAGKHLGSPKTKSRVTYGYDYFINWKTDGLTLVKQARDIIESHNAAPVADM